MKKTVNTVTAGEPTQKPEGKGCGCVFLFLCMALVAALSGGGVYFFMTWRQKQVEQVRQDSIREEHRLAAERHAQYAAAYEQYVKDSIREAKYQTPDLQTFGVKGKVERIEQHVQGYHESGFTVEFDDRGVLTHYYDSDGREASIRRNDQQRIELIERQTDDAFKNFSIMYEYNPNGTVACFGSFMYGPSREHYTEYNDYGAPTRSYLSTMENSKIPRHYIYEQYDEHQNWTRRRMKDDRGPDWDAIFTRSITYHPSGLHKPTE